MAHKTKYPRLQAGWNFWSPHQDADLMGYVNLAQLREKTPDS